MPIVLERDIEEAVRVKAREKLGLTSTKLNLRHARDWPDRLFWIPGGRPFLIEFKRPGEHPTPKQAARIEELRSLGYDVEVHTDKEEAFAALCAAVESAQLPKARRPVST
jgi:hypothetical protein